MVWLVCLPALVAPPEAAYAFDKSFVELVFFAVLLLMFLIFLSAGRNYDTPPYV